VVPNANVNFETFADKRPTDIIRDADGGAAHVAKLAPAPADIVDLPDLDPDVLRDAALDRGIDWQDDYDSRVRRFVASDDRPDRHGDIIQQDWELDDFERNPVILWSHESWRPPIGRSLAEHLATIRDKTTGTDHKALVIDVLFAGADISDEADRIFRLVESGFLSTGSVGFKAGAFVEVEDDEERQRLGLGRYGYVIERPRLIEYSITPVPANVGAELVAAEKSGRISAADATFIRGLSSERPMAKKTETTGTTKTDTNKKAEDTPVTRKELDEFREKLLADVAGAAKSSLPKPAEKTDDGDETSDQKFERRLAESDVELKKARVELFVVKKTHELRDKGCPLTSEQIREKLLEPDTDEGRRLMAELLSSKKQLPTDSLGEERPDAVSANAARDESKAARTAEAVAEYRKMEDGWKKKGLAVEKYPFTEENWIDQSLR
jgi:hypothetical protein